MTLYEVIAQHCANSAFLVGSTVHVGSIPADTDLPAVTFSLVSGPPIVSHEGRNPSRNEIWQIAGNAWYLYDAAVIREGILKTMDTFTGLYDGIDVQSCVPERSPRDIRDSTRGYWLAIQEFRIFYTVLED